MLKYLNIQKALGTTSHVKQFLIVLFGAYALVAGVFIVITLPDTWTAYRAFAVFMSIILTITYLENKKQEREKQGE